MRSRPSKPYRACRSRRCMIASCASPRAAQKAARLLLVHPQGCLWPLARRSLVETKGEGRLILLVSTRYCAMNRSRRSTWLINYILSFQSQSRCSSMKRSKVINWNRREIKAYSTISIARIFSAFLIPVVPLIFTVVQFFGFSNAFFFICSPCFLFSCFF